MSVFSQPVLDPCSPNTRSIGRAFLALFLVGAVVRGLVSFLTIGISHSDEHQQYLEQAHRLVYGYGVQFWEQDLGLRHPLYVVLLSVPLAAFKAVGLEDPLVQASLLRWLVAVAVLGAWSLFAWEFQRRGNTAAALVAMTMFSLLPDAIYLHVHPLSEIAATVPFLLGLVWLERRPFLAGVMLGLSFGIRFQMGFLVAALCLLVWAQRRCRFDRPVLCLGSGLALCLVGLGLSDELFYGDWFHSPLTYARANVVQERGNEWGVAPWYQYFIYLVLYRGWAINVPLALLIPIGVWREWKLALLALSFLVPHLMVAHKELRFLIPVTPLTWGLAAVGLAELYRFLARRNRCLALVVVLLAGLGSMARLPMIAWNSSPFRPSVELLRIASAQDDLTGVLIAGYYLNSSGNYFYLRRDVPLVGIKEPSAAAIRSHPECRDGRINYLICDSVHSDWLSTFDPEPIASRHGFTLFRLHAPPGSRSGPP